MKHRASRPWWTLLKCSYVAWCVWLIYRSDIFTGLLGLVWFAVMGGMHAWLSRTSGAPEDSETPQ